MKQTYSLIFKKKRKTSIVLVLAVILGVLPVNSEEMTNVKAAGYGISSPRTGSGSVTTWDCVYFGNYWQNDTNGDGVADQNDEKQPIKWRVLSVNGDDAFLLAEKNLDAQAYNKEYEGVTWETCTLRSWLNEEFFNNAFSGEEQEAVKETLVVNEDNPFYDGEGGNDTLDKVYLLSIAEAINPSYGFPNSSSDAEARDARSTEYVESADGSSYTWWLRSPGLGGNAAFVRDNGYILIMGYFVYRDDYTVRPVLHLNLSSSAWSKAGTVTVGEEIPESTATPRPTTKTPSATPKPTNKSTITAPSAVKKVTAKNKKKNSVTLTWKKVPRAKGYQVQYVINKKFAKKKSKLVARTKVIINKLKKKKTYYFRVRAYKMNGKKKVYGKWSKVKKIKIKK